MNKLILVGRLVKDPEKFKTDSGVVYCRFCVADKKSYKKETDTNGTNFHDCVAFNKTAENLCKYVRKGSQVSIVGQLDCRVSQRDGIRQKMWSVQCEQIEFIGEKVQFADKIDGDTADDTPKGAKEIDNDEDIPF